MCFGKTAPSAGLKLEVRAGDQGRRLSEGNSNNVSNCADGGENVNLKGCKREQSGKERQWGQWRRSRGSPPGLHEATHRVRELGWKSRTSLCSLTSK